MLFNLSYISCYIFVWSMAWLRNYILKICNITNRKYGKDNNTIFVFEQNIIFYSHLNLYQHYFPSFTWPNNIVFLYLQLQLADDNTNTAESIKAKNKDNTNSSRTESPTENTSQPSPELLIKHPLQVCCVFDHNHFP